MFTMAGVGSAQADTDGTSVLQSIHKSTSVAADTGPASVAVGGAKCAGCHRAHTAKAVDLLMDTQPALCYSCHGSLGSTLDVVDGINPYGGGALRGGGFQYALLNGPGATLTVTTDASAYGGKAKAGNVPVLTTGGTVVTSRHQIDGLTAGVMWGNGAVSAVEGGAGAGKSGVTLECGSCHDPHGNGNYRILKPVPNDAGTLVSTIITPESTNATTGVVTPAVMSAGPTGVAIPDVPALTPRNYTTTNYWDVRDRQVPAIALGTPPSAGTTDGYIANVSQWCSTCHTRYLAGSNSYKTPLTAGGVTDATFTYRHRSNRTDKEGVSRPNCIQCHVSHGSNVAMTGYSAAVKTPAGALPVAAGGSGDIGVPALTAAGTSRLLRVDNRGTCQMCHNK